MSDAAQKTDHHLDAMVSVHTEVWSRVPDVDRWVVEVGALPYSPREWYTGRVAVLDASGSARTLDLCGTRAHAALEAYARAQGATGLPELSWPTARP